MVSSGDGRGEILYHHPTKIPTGTVECSVMIRFAVMPSESRWVLPLRRRGDHHVLHILVLGPYTSTTLTLHTLAAMALRALGDVRNIPSKASAIQCSLMIGPDMAREVPAYT